MRTEPFGQAKLAEGLLADPPTSTYTLCTFWSKSLHISCKSTSVSMPRARRTLEWPTCMIRSRDTAGGQAPWNRHRKCMESADSAVQRQL